MILFDPKRSWQKRFFVFQKMVILKRFVLFAMGDGRPRQESFHTADERGVTCSVGDLDPGYGAFCPWFQDGKKLDPGSGMNIPDLIFEI